MKRLSNQLAYEQKAAEIRKLVEVEAKKLQNINESNDAAWLENKALEDEKARLTKLITELEGQLADKRKELQATIDREEAFLASVKHELKREQENLKAIRESITKAKSELEACQAAIRELKGSITKETKAKKQYEQTVKDLQAAEDKLAKTIKSTEASLKRLADEEKKIEERTKYLTELSGRIQSYVETAKTIVKQANAEFRRTGVPLNFRANDIIEIDLNNFTQLT